MSIASLASYSRNHWEDVFQAWSQPPGQAEQQRCENAIREIKEAISAHPRLHQRGVVTFPQGSYANRVNVREDSDVDVCCRHDGVFIFDLPAGYDRNFFGLNSPATYAYSDYKDDVEQALINRFGPTPVVTRGNKAIDVNSKQLGVDADVVATFAYRQYYLTGTGYKFHAGTALRTDRENKLITNFPQQQYDNGVSKNDATQKRFKKQVRTQKSLRNKMEDEGVAAALPIPSFLIESLCWCTPNSCYGNSTLFSDFEASLEWQYNATETEGSASTLKEVNAIKGLFGPHNEWTRQQVRSYLEAAWRFTH